MPFYSSEETNPLFEAEINSKLRTAQPKAKVTGSCRKKGVSRNEMTLSRVPRYLEQRELKKGNATQDPGIFGFRLQLSRVFM